MGVTIFYRGSLTDLDRVEDFEDRVLDLALELGAQATIWRTANDDDPRRMVRGVVVDLYPGQETTSLLIAPEGWLINLHEIEAAEKGQLAGPPWCFVKTQYGPVEGHVALVELLTVLKQEFFANLEVLDEGDYWHTRDLAALTAKLKHVQAAIDGLADGLRRYALSPEAAEDQEILLTRIERIAALVHRTLSRPAEHPPVYWDGEETAFGADRAADESRWDAAYKENRRRQENVHRAIEEHMARGDDIETAFDAAMHEETAAGLPDEPADAEALADWQEELETDEAEQDEPWRESLDQSPSGDCPNFRGDEDLASPSDDNAAKTGLSPSRRDFPRHPLQQRAMDLMLRLHKLLASGTQSPNSHRDVLLHGAGEILGGLAQAIGGLSQFSSDENGTVPFPESDLQPASGLSLVQLKRALRGAAFALGALFPLRADGTLDQAAFTELHAAIQGLQTDIFAELRRLRQRRADEC
jgi:hypothetical protein